MSRISTAEELVKKKEQIDKQVEKDSGKLKIRVHLSTCGLSSGAGKVLEAFQSEIKKKSLSDVVIQKASCIGLCGQETIVSISNGSRDAVIYHDITEEVVPRIVEEHIIGKKPVSDYVIEVG